MRIVQHRVLVATHGQGLYETTREISAWVEAQGMKAGLLTLFLRHTSASLLIQENASPAVQRDLAAFFARLAPETGVCYEHDDEGPDDMPAHIRAAVMPTQLSVPVSGGKLQLGTWQGVYVFEHRRMPHRREILLHLAGE
jgi:secondary thiamine-phosphate synthase enzyme